MRSTTQNDFLFVFRCMRRFKPAELSPVPRCHVVRTFPQSISNQALAERILRCRVCFLCAGGQPQGRIDLPGRTHAAEFRFRVTPIVPAAGGYEHRPGSHGGKEFVLVKGHLLHRHLAVAQEIGAEPTRHHLAHAADPLAQFALVLGGTAAAGIVHQNGLKALILHRCPQGGFSGTGMSCH